MARNLAKASWVVLPVGDGMSGVDGAGLTPTRWNALCAAALSPEGPGDEIESFAKGLALRVGAKFGESRVGRGGDKRPARAEQGRGGGGGGKWHREEWPPSLQESLRSAPDN